MIALLAVCLASAADLPMAFLSPGDIGQAEGVSVAAQVPESGLALLFNNHKPDLWYAPVAAIPDGDVVRIWYQRVCKSEKEYFDQRALCVGELRGENWTLPALDETTPAWGGPNNVVMRRSPHKPTWGGFNVFQIVRSGSAYRMLYWDQPEPPAEAGAMVAESKDGIRWEQRPGTVFIEHNDAYSLLEKDGEYIVYQTALEPWPDKPYPDNLDKFKRVLCVRTSRDMLTWSPQEVFLRPDKDDAPETEFYLLKVFAYGDGYAGLIMKYFGDPKSPNKHSAILKYELIVSNDARTWERPYRDTDIGFWSYADPFAVGDRLHFVIWKDGGMNTVAYRKDGIAAVVAEGSGSFTTRAFTLPASGIALNADARDGWIEAQLLNESGEPIDSVRARTGAIDDLRVPLALSEETIKKFAGRKCALRIRMEKAKLYAIEPAHR
jgi:hypothetical protein